ncbi:MAG: spermidine/putrescine transport system permease protein [Ascidiaceihabitans sp.]|jgi:spermidine/putrescine transport system permease protein
MSSKFVSRIALGVYLFIFFGYLLGPLLVMSLTAFNSSGFPSVSPWACFSYEWFNVLFNDQRILNGIKNSVIIGIGTVILSVSIGMAAALVLTQVWPKLRTTYYTIIIAPILIPGVVLGISTIVFWDRVSQVFGPSTDALFHNGLFLTILGQSTFIASYAMLIFIARLQRFDPDLTEAALDLGATHTQAFRKIMLPFLRPAIASAAVLAFLASFENYNTTTFTFGNYPTLTIELAQKVRYGINPSISALAFIIVVLTVFGALAFEAFRRNAANTEKLKTAKVAPKPIGTARKLLSGNPAALMLVMLSFLVIAMVGTAQSHSPEQCKLDVRAAKQIEINLRIEALNEKRRLQNLENQLNAPEAPTVNEPKQAAPSSSGAFGGVFQGLGKDE